MRASLFQVYGIHLSELLADESTNWLEVADLVAWLPAGCAFWKDYGGPAALSDEVRLLREVEYQLRVLDWRVGLNQKGSAPKRHPDPQYAHEKRVSQSRQANKADRFLKRQQRS